MEPSGESDFPCSNGFNWAQLVKMPIVSDEWHHGHQILNFYPMDKDYRESPPARTMVAEHFGNAQALDTDAELLKFGSDHVTLPGAFLEMGVCTGRTINSLPLSIPGNASGDSIPLTAFLSDGPGPISPSHKVPFGPTSRAGCHRSFTT